MSDDKPWLTVAEAAEQSGISVRTLQRWLEDGKIAGWKPGRDWFVTLDSVTDYKRKVKMGRPKKKNT